jgi:hypothetical protein
MIKGSDIEKAIEELKNSKGVKIKIELSAQEAYSLVAAFQVFKTKHNNLRNASEVGYVAARRLHSLLKDSCPRLYILLDNGWKFTESEPKKLTDITKSKGS